SKLKGLAAACAATSPLSRNRLPLRTQACYGEAGFDSAPHSPEKMKECMSRSVDHNRMFAHETEYDAADIFFFRHVGEWIILKWRGDLFPPPQGKAYGTHLAAFLLCPFGSEIRGLNFCWLYRSKDNRPFRVGPPLTGINATWFFKYSTLRQFDAEGLSPQDICFLDLPDLRAELHACIPPVVIAIRTDQRLDPFRCSGYPDDVSVTCGPSFTLPKQGVEFATEQVWVRLSNKEDSTIFRGELLNQPQFYALRKGETVAVRLMDTDGRNLLVCMKHNAP
ncbi:MAG: hypothetical protein JXB13_04460, partial [Phycisphaerae bacterium]|nr:hypothetical protein [Phycisphaerae bacterium]